MKFNLFKKKTREEEVNKRTQDVFTILVSNSDYEFTELELVQISNNVRRQLSGFLKTRKAEFLDQSINANQRSIEIRNAIDLLE
jgi:hypothetical protein